MTSREQARAMVLVRVAGGELTVTDAATLLGLSVRQVRRLRAAFERDGPAALDRLEAIGREQRRRHPGGPSAVESVRMERDRDDG